MKTKDAIRLLLAGLDRETADGLEDDDLEFKAWEPDPKKLAKLLRELAVCFANARGGTIVLGVHDGVRSRRDAIRGIGPYEAGALRRAVYDGTEPHILVDLEELVEPEGKLLLVHVPKGIPPHTTSDGLGRIRVGKECKPLTGSAYAQILVGGLRDPSAEVIPGSRLEDLDREEIAQLRGSLHREPGKRDLADLGDADLLAALGLLHRDEVTVAAVLTLGKLESISRYVPQHEVTFLHHHTPTRYDQRSDLRGPLLSVLREIEQLVSANNRVHTIQESGFGQLELPDLSWEVAREAVLNAVTHRDYFQRRGVTVALHRDNMDVISPGGFPEGITPRNVLRHPPIHRNELLARVFQTAGFVNRIGMGVDRIYDGLLRLGKDLPVYTADESHVRLVIPLKTNADFVRVVVRAERGGQRLELDDLIALRSILRHGALDRWSASEALGSSPEDAAARLVKLREAGYLVPRGRGGGVSYVLRRDLDEVLRGRAVVDSEAPLDEEGVRLRILKLLSERGRLTSGEIQRFSGFSRAKVYRITRDLAEEKRVRFVGHGRGAFVVPTEMSKRN